MRRDVRFGHAASEILHSVHRARGAAIRGRRAAWAETVIARFSLLGLDLAAARAHARCAARPSSSPWRSSWRSGRQRERGGSRRR